MAIDMKKFGNVKNGVAKWHEYCDAFSFGRKTGVDIPYEQTGLLPDTNLYNKMYNDVWNSCTMLFVGMGQGEVALTPIQLTNAMCIIANKGYYYTPHFVRSIGNNENDTMLAKFHEKHVVTHIPDSMFSIVALGMQDVVERGTGKVAQLPGINVCAKTGTVENKAAIGGQAVKMKDHSVFVAFAPREDPKIAIAVVVENAGYGATWAGPVASLMMEKYLNDSIATNRKHLEEKMYNANLVSKYTYIIDSARRARDLRIWERKVERERIDDSTARARDSIYVRKWVEKHIINKKK